MRGMFAALALVSLAAPALAKDAYPLVVRGDRLFIPLTINGRQAEALLDSGAEATFLDDDFAKELGVALEGNETVKGSGGEDSVSFAKGLSIKAAETELKDVTAAVLDLDGVATQLVKSKLVMILGRDFFDAGRFEIDIERSTIRPLSPREKPKGNRLPLITHRGIEEFPVTIEGGAPVQAALDLGNGSEMMVGRQAAERLGLATPERVVERKAGGGIGGTVQRDIIRLSRVTIAGKTFTDVRAAIDDQDSQSDANVGVNMLRHFVIVTDFPGHTLWLRKR